MAAQNSRQLLVAALIVSWATSSFATSIDKRPRPACLFADGKQFLVQDTSFSVALYVLGNPQSLMRFEHGKRIEQFAATTDEWFLLIGGGERLSLWDVRTGQQLWRRADREIDSSFIPLQPFSQDGTACVVCGRRGVLILDVQTGRTRTVIHQPDGQRAVPTAALAPDGRSGAFVDSDNRLFTFDALTGHRTDTGHTGGISICFSANGKYLLVRCLAEDTGPPPVTTATADGTKVPRPTPRTDRYEHLSVLAMDGSFRRTDVGRFEYIGLIRAMPDGCFLTVAQRPGDRDMLTGFSIDPSHARVSELWKQPGGYNGVVGWETDFHPELMIGVTTDFKLRTSVADLKTGQLIQEIDNFAGYSWPGDDGAWWRIATGVVVLLAIAVGVWFARRLRVVKS